MTDEERTERIRLRTGSPKGLRRYSANHHGALQLSAFVPSVHRVRKLTWLRHSPADCQYGGSCKVVFYPLDESMPWLATCG